MKKFVCPCGSREYRKLFTSPCNSHMADEGRGFHVLECAGCGLRFTDPWPEQSKLKKFYIEEYYGENNFRFNFFVEFFVHFFRMARVKKILKFKHKGRALDVGVGRGLVLYELRKKGWDVVGTEQTDKAAFHSRNVLGLNIHAGNFIDIPLEENSFDVVTFWHVLEHLTDPFSSLEKARKILKPGGLLILAVPNSNSFQARVSKGHWFHLDMPYHLFHFSDQWLKGFLEKNGFGKIKINHFSIEFNPFGLLQSLLNRMGFEFNLLYNILKSGNFKKSILETKRKKQFEIFAVLIICIIFIFPCMAVSTIMSMLKSGGTIEIFALKSPD